MSSAPRPRKISAGDLDRFLERPAEDSALTAYLEAAAVLTAFDPFTLRPFGRGRGAMSREELVDHLVRTCEPVTQGSERGLWSLLLPVRRPALRRLAKQHALSRALAANPDRPNTPTQRMFERLIDGTPIDLGAISREELAALFPLHEWTDGIMEGLPDLEAVSRALTRYDLLAPMRRLAGEDFVGRKRETAQLTQYLLRSEKRNILFVYGTGGVGKSTLLAHFILDRVVPADIPFAYLDIDRPLIRPDRPMSLLLEAVTQLEPQLRLPPGATQGLVKEIAAYMRRSDRTRAYESGARSYHPILRQCGELLGRALDGSRALIVVDTFEEAEFLGPDVVWPLLQFLHDWDEALPTTRFVLSGRTLPRDYLVQSGLEPLLTASADDPDYLAAIPLPYRPVNLGVLDPGAARELVRRSVRLAGLSPLTNRDISDVIRIVSPNPMCLKLAVRLLREEGVEKLRDSRSVLLTRLKAEKIQALLYGRILHHLHQRVLRAVAYPGLVVRRITAEVIREVLAGPCQLDLGGEHDEYALIQALSAETALVYTDPRDGSLRHRSDVRRVMLEDLTDHVPATVVAEIDSKAVDFYAQQSGPVARAEELYHRLRLRQPETILDERWLPEAAEGLKNVGDELPARQRLWLASRFGITLDPSVRQAASQEEWEDQAARSAERYLQSGAGDRALEVLRERRTRLPRSRLYHLETEALRLLHRPGDALKVARAGVAAATRAGAIDMALNLLLTMVVIEEGRGHLDAAADLLDEAGMISGHSANPVLQFRVMVTRLRIDRRMHPFDEERRSSLRADAAAAITPELLDLLRTEPVLLREAAAELAQDHPQLVSAALETLGVEVGTDSQAYALGQAIASLSGEEGPGTATDATFLNPVPQFEGSVFTPDLIRKWATEDLTERDTRALGSTVGNVDAGAAVLGNFRDYFRAGVDDSLEGGGDAPGSAAYEGGAAEATPT